MSALPPAYEDTSGLPPPWVREWDATYSTWLYINPTAHPPTTSWTHPAVPPGQAHPEQLQALQRKQIMPSMSSVEGDVKRSGDERGFGEGFGGLAGPSNMCLQQCPPPVYQAGFGEPAVAQQGFAQQSLAQQPLAPRATPQTNTLGFGSGMAAGGLATGAAFLAGKMFTGGRFSTALFGHNMGPPPFLNGALFGGGESGGGYGAGYGWDDEGGGRRRHDRRHHRRHRR